MGAMLLAVRALLVAGLALVLALGSLPSLTDRTALAAPLTSGSPVGNLEVVRGVLGGVEVTGWAIDADSPGAAYVWVTIDGVGRHLLANGPRPDVAAALPGSGPNHGFSAIVPASPGSRSVCATVSNVGPGAHTALGCRRVTVIPTATPFGNVELVRRVEGGFEVRGWAIDPSTTDPIYVWVTVDGVGLHLHATIDRPDVGAAYPEFGSAHGFAGTVRGSSSAGEVCVTASNVGPGNHTLLGCRSFGVTGNAVAEAQAILAKFGIPGGPVDGVWGARTAQGLCTFRQIAGLPVSRGNLTAADLAKLRAFNAAYGSLAAIPATVRAGRSTYFLASRTCQTMLYAQNGAYSRVFRISTGKPGFETPTGGYVLGGTQPGWSCSTIYPEGCYHYATGMNARTRTKNVPYSTFGNMYNKRSIRGAYLLHGSNSVPTYPASHGCVRVSVSDSDWLYRNITNSGGVIYMQIIGSY